MKDPILPRGRQFTDAERDRWKRDYVKDLDSIDWTSLGELECVELAIDNSKHRISGLLDREPEDKRVMLEIVHLLQTKLEQAKRSAEESSDVYKYLKRDLCMEICSTLKVFETVLSR